MVSDIRKRVRKVLDPSYLGRLVSFNVVMTHLGGQFSHESVRSHMIKLGCTRTPSRGVYKVPNQLKDEPVEESEAVVGA